MFVVVTSFYRTQAMSSFLFSSYLLHFNCKFVPQKITVYRVQSRLTPCCSRAQGVHGIEFLPCISHVYRVELTRLYPLRRLPSRLQLSLLFHWSLLLNNIGSLVVSEILPPRPTSLPSRSKTTSSSSTVAK